jgi:RNA polymerase sigma factor (sigma-70 family)
MAQLTVGTWRNPGVVATAKTLKPNIPFTQNSGNTPCSGAKPRTEIGEKNIQNSTARSTLTMRTILINWIAVMSSCAQANSPAASCTPLAAGFFKEHQPWLLQRLHARINNRADAEDLASETFLRVIVLPNLAKIDTPRAFLTTIAKRLIYNLWRRRDLEQAYLDALAHLPEAVAPSPEECALLLESLEAIARALETLPDKARRAFLMSQLDEMTYADIATHLGVSASMVRKYMVQAWQACAMASAEPA